MYHKSKKNCITNTKLRLDCKGKDNILYINPGSFTGAFSPLIEDTIPSFILMVLTGDEAIVYVYTLNDRNKKFDVIKYDYKKGAENFPPRATYSHSASVGSLKPFAFKLHSSRFQIWLE